VIAHVYKVNQREEEKLLAPVLTLLAVAVALLYCLVGLAFIASAWSSSHLWCAVGLTLFALRKLAWKR
jgi:hypothetical protein